jgi:hypothetical protein
MTYNQMLYMIERKIVELENDTMSDPRIQALLDLEAEIVLQEYFETAAWDASDVLVENESWLDE